MTYPASFHSSEPSDRDLDALERIAGRRAEIEAVRPADARQVEIREFLLATLDRMEEDLCARGCGCASVAAGWRCLADLESFAGRGAAVRGAGKNGQPQPRTTKTNDGGIRDEPSNDD